MTNTTAVKTATEILEVSSFKNFFKGAYKEGPIRRDIVFSSTDMESARLAFKEYLKAIDGRSMNRCHQIGQVELFALDLDSEIKKIKERNSL